MIIARKKEQAILKEALNNDESQFIAIYGRRRVGKTFLVNETYQNEIVFSHSGVYKGTYKEQLNAFSNKLDYYGLKKYKKTQSEWTELFMFMLLFISFFNSWNIFNNFIKMFESVIIQYLFSHSHIFYGCFDFLF